MYDILSTFIKNYFTRPIIWIWSWLRQPRHIKNIETKLIKKIQQLYEDKYKDKFKNIVEYVNNNKEYKNRKEPIPLTLFVMENTPCGLVIMRYNEQSKTFEYYCDRTTIIHKYLEVVARKYSITFICPQIYSVMDTEIKLSNELFKEQKREREKKENDNKKNGLITKKSVFARLKNTPFAKLQTKPPTKSIINQYLRIGHTSEFNPLNSHITSSIKNTHKIEDTILAPGTYDNSNKKTLSYKDFVNKHNISTAPTTKIKDIEVLQASPDKYVFPILIDH
jgi:hypothetical protein